MKKITIAQDPITEEVTSFSVGEVWMYFYKETLIGVREMHKNVSTFVTLDTKTKSAYPRPPTLEYLSEDDILEAIHEVQTTNETIRYTHVDDIFAVATDAIAREIKRMVTAAITGKDE